MTMVATQLLGGGRQPRLALAGVECQGLDRQLRRSPLESTCYVVEVCTACAWNQLVRSFRLGNTRASST